MPIVDIPKSASPLPKRENEYSKRDRFLSAISGRFFFFVLLVMDIFWSVTSLLLFIGYALATIGTFGKVDLIREGMSKKWLSFCRSLVCALALFIACISPVLGIMTACTYFLMYDKTGIQEVVPSSLQAQFKEFFKGI